MADGILFLAPLIMKTKEKEALVQMLVLSRDTVPLKMCVYPHTNIYLNVPSDINFPLHLADLGFVSKWTRGPISRLSSVVSSYTDLLLICTDETE